MITCLVHPCLLSPAGNLSSTPADDNTEYAALLTTTQETVSAADLDSACASSLELTNLHSIISKGWPPSPKGLNPDHDLSIKDNYVFRGFRLIVPGMLRHALISIAHESPQGVVRTKQ